MENPQTCSPMIVLLNTETNGTNEARGTRAEDGNGASQSTSHLPSSTSTSTGEQDGTTERFDYVQGSMEDSKFVVGRDGGMLLIL